MNYNSNRGFSIIELMIAVAIVGILGAIALPSYMASVVKGKRAEARTALLELLQQQERYMTQQNCYVIFTTNAGGTTTPLEPSPTEACGGVTPASAPFKGFSSNSLANSSYLLSATTCSDGASGTLSIADCVRVKATPIKPDPDAGALSITSTGSKSCDGLKPEVCWK